MLNHESKPDRRTALKVIVVDDSSAVVASLCQFFAEFPRVTVVATAGDGLEAIDHAEVHQPDLIVMDISMPRLGGYRAATAIRKLVPLVRIILISIHEGDEIRNRSLRYADSFIPKIGLRKQLRAEMAHLFPGHSYPQ